jgi:hypothetical protein
MHVRDITPSNCAPGDQRRDIQSGSISVKPYQRRPSGDAERESDADGTERRFVELQ